MAGKLKMKGGVWSGGKREKGRYEGTFAWGMLAVFRRISSVLTIWSVGNSAPRSDKVQGEVERFDADDPLNGTR